MTKAHVPPQCAGNTGLVTRASHMLDSGGMVSLGRREIGGIYYAGQCDTCNNIAGADFDPAYGKMAAALNPLWAKASALMLPPVLRLPHVPIRPGAAARSIILGMCALTPVIRREMPAQDLLDAHKTIVLPSGFRLFLALARGKTAWVSGTMSGSYVAGPRRVVDVDGTAITLHAIASVFFPPLAWQLVHRPGSVLLERDGWADISDWCAMTPQDVQFLDDLVPALPAVVHPRHQIGGDIHRADLLNDEMCPIIECFDVTDPASIEGAARAKRMERVSVPIEEFKRAAARWNL